MIFKRGIEVKESLKIGMEIEYVDSVLIHGNVKVFDKNEEPVSVVEVVADIPADRASNFFKRLSENDNPFYWVELHLKKQFNKDYNFYPDMGESLVVIDGQANISCHNEDGTQSGFISEGFASGKTFNCNGENYYIPEKEETK